jgi:hypothetical protein
MSEVGPIYHIGHKEGSQNVPYWERNSGTPGYAILIIDDHFRRVLRYIRDDEKSPIPSIDNIRTDCLMMMDVYREIELVVLAGFELIGKIKEKEHGPCYDYPPSILREYKDKNRLLILLDFWFQTNESDVIDSKFDDIYGFDVYHTLTGVWDINEECIAFYTRDTSSVKNAIPAKNPVCIPKGKNNYEGNDIENTMSLTDWLDSRFRIDVCEEIISTVKEIWNDESSGRGHQKLPDDYPMKEIFEAVWSKCCKEFLKSQCKKALFFQDKEGAVVAPSDVLSCHSWDFQGRTCRADALCELIQNLIFKDYDIKNNVKVKCNEDIRNTTIPLPCAPGIVFIYWLIRFIRKLDNYSGDLELSARSDGTYCLSLSMNCPQELYGKVITRDKGTGAISELRSLLQCIIPNGLEDCSQENHIQEETGTRMADSSLFSVGDILDWPGFFSKLQQNGKKYPPNPSKRIWGLLPSEIKSLIENSPDYTTHSEEDKSKFVSALNEILNQKDFYRQQDYITPDLPTSVRELLECDQNDLSDKEVQKLNRLLIQAAYPHEIGKIGGWIAPVLELRAEKNKLQLCWDRFRREY